MSRSLEQQIDDELAVPRTLCAGPCKRLLPRTSEYFHAREDSPDCLHAMCKNCRAEKRAKDEANELQKKLRRLGLETLEKAVASSTPNLLTGNSHIASTMEEVTAIFGGAQGFAKHIYAQYLMSKPGSPNRTKILLQLLNLQLKITEAGYCEKTLDDLSDAELLERLEQETNKLRLRVHPEVKDAS